MELTQAEYKLYTKEKISYSENDWDRLTLVGLARLARFLCLDVGELPQDENNNLPDDFKLLLANFIAGMLRFAGNGSEVTSKRISNFTINFKSGAANNAFAQVRAQYPDIIAQYSQCDDMGFTVEGNGRYCCGYI